MCPRLPDCGTHTHSAASMVFVRAVTGSNMQYGTPTAALECRKGGYHPDRMYYMERLSHSRKNNDPGKRTKKEEGQTRKTIGHPR